MTNRLAGSASPYLLQHAENPVNWHPWGAEALEKARIEDKPIFLSIGYAACHWCHVMAHESFEDPQTADLLNQHFVAIKVDREERPDLDGVYMSAVVAMTGQGGWPMSVFLTPEGEPFYGGTYFPPTRRYGMPAFKEVLSAAAQAWQDDRAEIRKAGRKMAEQLVHLSSWGEPDADDLRPNLLEQVTQTLLSTYDWKFGGWGQAPRFPQPMTLEFLLLQASRGAPRALDAVVNNLDFMSRGGLFDVVGGGFHRYSTDDRWLVPHFEKMLYDNAQLALVYLHAGQLAGRADVLDVSRRTLDFILRELTSPAGGFFSSLDADSDGGEGHYYLWTKEEIHAILAPAGLEETVKMAYPLPANGNFERKIILQRPAAAADLAAAAQIPLAEWEQRLADAHRLLLEARASRPRPFTDDKVLTAWNGLAIRALAEASLVFDRADYLAAAQRAARFLLTELRPAGRLVRSWREGQTSTPAFLEDYAALILALLSLYQVDFDTSWYHQAVALADEMVARFADPAGGFFDTPVGADTLLTRPKDYQDNATPCGNSLAAQALLTLFEYTSREEWRTAAVRAISSLQDGFVRHPTAFGLWLQAADFAAGPVTQVALSGDPTGQDTRALLHLLRGHFRPRTITALAGGAHDAQEIPLLRDRSRIDGRATAYVCRQFVCALPVTDAQALMAQLDPTAPESGSPRPGTSVAP